MRRIKIVHMIITLMIVSLPPIPLLLNPDYWIWVVPVTLLSCILCTIGLIIGDGLIKSSRQKGLDMWALENVKSLCNDELNIMGRCPVCSAGHMFDGKGNPICTRDPSHMPVITGSESGISEEVRT